MILKEVVPPEVWASISPRCSSQATAGGGQSQPQGLVSTSVDSELPVLESEASIADSDEPVGWSVCRSGSTPNSGDIQDIFNLTSDEESDAEIENLGNDK